MMCRIAARGRTGHFLAGVVAMGVVAGLAVPRPGPRAASPPAVIAAPAYAPRLRSIRETIHEVESWPGCGVLVFATRVRYDDVSAIVPCIELVENNGPRFAVGDTHELVVDECDEVRAIIWRGRRYPLDGFPTVIAPASLTEFTMTNDYQTDTVRYDAPGWHWPAPRRVDCGYGRNRVRWSAVTMRHASAWPQIRNRTAATRR